MRVFATTHLIRERSAFAARAIELDLHYTAR